VLVKTRDRAYRRMLAAESVDTDGDGTPDVYERPHDQAR